MGIVRSALLLLAGGVLALGPSAALAGYGGDSPVLCALTQVAECHPGSGCEPTTLEEVALPTFLQVDLKMGELRGHGVENPRKTPIVHQRQEGGSTILQGAENGRAWSIVIVEESGAMTGTVAGEETGFVVFGVCTPL